MKKFLLTLAALSLAVAGLAGTYTLTLSTAQDNRLEKERVRVNTATCALVQLPPTCTQPQARNAKDSAGNPIPGASSLDIYSSIQDFLDRYVVPASITTLKVKDTQDDQVQFCTWWSTATNAQRTASVPPQDFPTAARSVSS